MLLKRTNLVVDTTAAVNPAAANPAAANPAAATGTTANGTATEAADGGADGGAAGDELGPVWRHTAALAHVEMALLLLHHRKVSPAELEVEAAKSVLGLGLSLVGAMGKRTKFQEKELSQLTMRATLAPHALPRPAVRAGDAGPMPHRVDEEDDTLLSQARLIRVRYVTVTWPVRRRDVPATWL